jgi:hypothetical protein
MSSSVLFFMLHLRSRGTADIGVWDGGGVTEPTMRFSEEESNGE